VIPKNSFLNSYLGKSSEDISYGDNFSYSSDGFLYGWHENALLFKDGESYPYTTGDYIGVGYYHNFQAIFFTKNKTFLGFQLPCYISKGFFAVCLASPNAEVEVNIGVTPFFFTDFTASLTTNLWRTIVDAIWCVLLKTLTFYDNLKKWDKPAKVITEFGKALFAFGQDNFISADQTWWLPILARGLSIAEKQSQQMDANVIDKTDPLCVMERCLRVILWIIHEQYKIKSIRHELLEITPEQDLELYLGLYTPIQRSNLLRSVS